MNVYRTRIICLIGLCATAAMLLPSLATADTAPAYVIAQVAVEDAEAFATDYTPHVGPTIKAAGGEVIVSAKDAEMLEGDRDGNLTVIIKFPSVDAARSWYNSDAYKATIPARLDSTTSNRFTLVPGMQAAQGN